jgi:hypothetical protein
MAVSGRRPGPVLASDCRVDDGADDSPRARAQCRPDGSAATPPARHADSFRSGHPVRQRCVAPLLPLKSPGAEYEPKGQLLGQLRRRIVLQQPEERTDQETDLQEPRLGDRGRRSIHRLVLQFNAPSQSSRRRQSGAVRSRSQAASKGSPLKPGNSITVVLRIARDHFSVGVESASGNYASPVCEDHSEPLRRDELTKRS